MLIKNVKRHVASSIIVKIDPNTASVVVISETIKHPNAMAKTLPLSFMNNIYSPYEGVSFGRKPRSTNRTKAQTSR